MKNTCKKLSALALALLMLISAAACTGSGDTTDTTNSDTSASDTSTDTKAPDAEATTEEVTLPAPEDYEVSEKDGTATVTTPLGLTYTVTGYTALDKATATVGDALTYTFSEEAFSEKFNRFTLTYSATAPVKVWTTYTERGKTTEEYFFLDAKEGQFSGLNTGYMDGYSARKLTALRVEPLTDQATAFTLAGVSTEKLDKLPRTYYLESDRYKLGIDLGWGGTVSYLEDKACTIPDLVNLVNRHDTGRLIQ